MSTYAEGVAVAVEVAHDDVVGACVVGGCVVGGFVFFFFLFSKSKSEYYELINLELDTQYNEI